MSLGSRVISALNTKLFGKGWYLHVHLVYWIIREICVDIVVVSAHGMVAVELGALWANHFREECKFVLLESLVQFLFFSPVFVLQGDV